MQRGTVFLKSFISYLDKKQICRGECKIYSFRHTGKYLYKKEKRASQTTMSLTLQILQTNQQNPSLSLNNTVLAVQWILNLSSHSSYSHALRHKPPLSKLVLQERVKLQTWTLAQWILRLNSAIWLILRWHWLLDEGSNVPILTFQLPAGNALALTFPHWLLNCTSQSNEPKYTHVSIFSLPHTHPLLKSYHRFIIDNN